MKRVFLCSPTNSTMFTRCCETAICDDQSFCPKCRQEVYPGEGHTDHQRAMMRWEMAYGPTRRLEQARRGKLAAQEQSP